MPNSSTGVPSVPSWWRAFLAGRRRRREICQRRSRATWFVAAQVLEDRALLSAPTLDWGFALGNSSSSARINSTAVDNSGDVYVAGVVTQGTVDLDPGAGTANITANNQTGFVAKYDPDGNFLWVETFSSDKSVNAFSLTVDATDGVYVAGGFAGTTTFGVGESNPATLVNQGGVSPNGFIAKFDQTTGDVEWVDGVMGTMALATNNVAVDAAGNVYIAGQASAGTITIINGHTGATINSFSNTAGNYVAKLTTSGGVTWAQGFAEGNATVTPGGGLAVDTAGNVYLAGALLGKDVDFDPGAGTFELSRTAVSSNSFVVKLDTAGDFQWATKDTATGFNGTSVSSIAVDSSGNSYITMQQQVGGWWACGGWGEWSWGARQGGRQQLAKIDSSGNWQWTKTLQKTPPSQNHACFNDPFWNAEQIHDFWENYEPGHGDAQFWLPTPSGEPEWSHAGAGGSFGGGWHSQRNKQSVSSTTAKLAIDGSGNPVVVSARTGATKYDSAGNQVWTTDTPLPATDIAAGPSGAIVFVGLFRGELNVSPDGTFELDANTAWWDQAPFVVKWVES